MKFVQQLKELSTEVHTTAVEHGWWETGRSIEECLELIHCELAEAVEGWRGGSNPCLKLQGESTDGVDFTTVEEEMADVMIRVLDLAGKEWKNWGLISDIIDSMAKDEGLTLPLDNDELDVNFHDLGLATVSVDSADLVGRDLSFLEDVFYMRESMAAARVSLDRAIPIIVIFCAKLSAKYELRTIQALMAKAEYNKSRPYRHGNKLA